MKNLLLKFLLLMPVFCFAQEIQLHESEFPEEVFNIVEQMPRFIGCEELEISKEERKECAIEKLYEFIYSNLNYPELAIEKSEEGKVVIRFVVDKKGYVQNAEIIRDIGAGCGAEAQRVVNLMSEKVMWVPGKQRGQLVNVYFNLPVEFELEKEVEEVVDLEWPLEQKAAFINQQIDAFKAKKPIENLSQLPSGLNIQLLKKGNGPKPVAGQTLEVHYYGTLLSNKESFDNSFDREKPFTFQIGLGRTIKGWEEGLLKLTEGSTAILYIPPYLAYGEKGAGKIGPNEDLVYYVEFSKVMDTPDSDSETEKEIIPEATNNDDDIFKVVEQMPRFPGCEHLKDKDERSVCSQTKLLEFIYEEVKYPKKALKKRTQGTAIVQFVIYKNGHVGEIKIIRDPGNGLGEEAKRVVEAMNEKGHVWTPGMQKGKPVSVYFNLPIKFRL